MILPKRILLDLDDVLNDFTMFSLRRLGCKIDEYKPEWGWDIVKAYNETRSFPYPATPEIFWAQLISRTFWEEAPLSRESSWLITMTTLLVEKENVFILTSPTRDPECLAGKLKWIHDRLPSWIHRQYSMSPAKHLCARTDTLLIDDRDKNVEEFREAGGQAILVPRPWNSLHGTDTMDHLEEAFTQLFEAKKETTERGNHEANQFDTSISALYPSYSLDGFQTSVLVRA